jgi:hypothetical protein
MIGIVVIAMTLLLSGCAKQIEQTVPITEPTQTAAPEPLASQLQEVQNTPTEVEKCGTDVVLTYTGCIKQADNNINVSFINSGKGVIDGVWVYVYGTDGKVGYEEVKETINIKDTKAYEVDLVKWTTKLGAINNIVFGPEKGSNVCINQKQSIKPTVNCK